MLRALIQTSSYLHFLIDTLTGLSRPIAAETLQRLHFTNSKATEFLADRLKIYDGMHDCYDVHGACAVIDANVPGVRNDLKRCEEAIETAQRALAVLAPPFVDPAHPDFAALFVQQCNPRLLQSVYQACVRARETMTTIMGRARGQLTSAVVRPNFWALLEVTRLRTKFSETLALGRGGKRAPGARERSGS